MTHRYHRASFDANVTYDVLPQVLVHFDMPGFCVELYVRTSLNACRISSFYTATVSIDGSTFLPTSRTDDHTTNGFIISVVRHPALFISVP